MSDNPSSSCILRDYERTFVQKICTRVIKRGPMPRHIAIIMDGNRRYAREMGLATVSEGHRKGEDKLLEVIKMYLDLGIEEMTVYSLSDQNLKRSPAELKGIMNLTLNRMRRICTVEGNEELRDRGLKWDMNGDWNKILSAEMKSLFAKTCLFTRGHQTLKMHFAFGYSSQGEIRQGIGQVVEGLQNGQLDKEDVNEQLLNDVMNLEDNVYPVDILIRTGGDHRYSDFLLWQSSRAYLHFVDATWPEFSHSDLLWGIFYYQHQVVFEGLPRNEKIQDKKLSKKGQEFVQNTRRQRWDYIASHEQ